MDENVFDFVFCRRRRHIGTADRIRFLRKQVSGKRVDGKRQRCVSESCSNKKGMNRRPSLNLFDRYQFNLFLLTMSQICNP